ncbi:hypothetical protein VMCG_07658 [Cytospora schulzeri]|uniref:Uncharacterized protein n=1 Tax=Cytospora schulzeri TaxID=448051 RepID=A0A423VYZ0_9PEZI|nr:hypothetical protein VMCG_07658 [Valsa malicola]
MCGTTWLEHSRCQHSERIVQEDSKCAIGYADPNSRFHWEEAQGIVHIDDLCRTCQGRLDRHGTTDPSVCWTQLNEVLSRARSASAVRRSVTSTSSFEGFKPQWKESRYSASSDLSMGRKPASAPSSCPPQ